MMNNSRKLTLAFVLLLPAAISATSLGPFAQRKTTVPVCKAAVLAAFNPLPKLKYRCDTELGDYEEKVLKQPNRKKAINVLEQRLESFTSPDWWQASVEDLRFCELRRKPGVLNKEEQEKVGTGDYTYDLLGNHSVRLALLPDPCYMTGYFGSNGFLLFRKAGKVFATQVLDGFSSRADNPVGLDFAYLNGQLVIEISTGTGGLHLSITNYCFVINPKTNKAVPKKLFRGDQGLTNSIFSDLLMSEPEELDLPKDAGELSIIRRHKLAPAFSIYAEDSEGKIETPRGKMTRTILKWNGRFYQ